MPGSHVRRIAPPRQRALGGYMYAVERKDISRAHSRWSVHRVRGAELLGEIRWWPGWRQYAFWPEPSTIFNTECLRALTDFVYELNRGKAHLETDGRESTK